MTTTINQKVASPFDNVVTAETNPVTGMVKILRPGGGFFPEVSQADGGVDYVASGLTLPSSGSIGVAALSSGTAYVSGTRVPVPATVLPLGASKDHYVDLDYDGALAVTQVTIGASAPALAANAIRLGMVTTGASAVSARSVDGADSLGNWMGNRISVPACILKKANGATFGGSVGPLTFANSNIRLNNAAMFNSSSSSSRVNIPKSGLYRVAFGFYLANGSVVYMKLKVNGSPTDDLGPEYRPTSIATVGEMTHLWQWDVPLSAGDYIESIISPNLSTYPFINHSYFSCVKVG